MRERAGEPSRAAAPVPLPGTARRSHGTDKAFNHVGLKQVWDANEQIHRLPCNEERADSRGGVHLGHQTAEDLEQAALERRRRFAAQYLAEMMPFSIKSVDLSGAPGSGLLKAPAGV